MKRKVVRRCGWVTDDPLYIRYHDDEWGRPVHDDRVLFEFLLLEGAQAGLSWSTILRKRSHGRFREFLAIQRIRRRFRRAACSLSRRKSEPVSPPL